MSFSKKILLGLTAGVLAGLFFGERIAPLQVVADAYVKLLQMTVLPFVAVSLVLGLGTLTYAQARRLALRAGAVLLTLWGVALAAVLLFPLMFPEIETASFFSTTLLDPPATFDFVGLYVPANPFYSLANSVVPAVVLFGIVLGIALIGVEDKARLLDVLHVVRQGLSRANGYIVSLMPYGLFAIAATAAGTLSLDQVSRVQVYLISYVAVALLVSLWILPGLIAVLTPVPHRAVLAGMHDVMITAFAAGDLFIVLPTLTDRSAALARAHGLAGDRQKATDVLVATSFNFPHTGKLLSLSFVLFAAWFVDAGLPLARYPQLEATGLLVLFGSVNVAIPFLLDLFQIPADTFQLFVASSVVNSRFGTLVAVMHTVTVAIVGSWALAGGLHVDRRRLTRYLVMSALLITATVVGVRLIVSGIVDTDYQGDRLIASMELRDPVPAQVLSATSLPADGTTPDRPALDRIRDRRAVRVGFLPDSLPYAYTNARGAVVGFDIAMAHQLARELGVQLQLIPLARDTMVESLTTGACDLVMSGVVVTVDWAAAAVFSTPYVDETMAFIVADHRRGRFARWDDIRGAAGLALGVPDLPYYVDRVQSLLPRAQVTRFRTVEEMFAAGGRGLDALMLTAERGSAWTLLHPEFSVVVPMPGLIKVPLAYPVGRRDARFAAFLDTWIDLKRKDGTIQALYDQWILGQDAAFLRPRWSIIRDVLHWVP